MNESNGKVSGFPVRGSKEITNVSVTDNIVFVVVFVHNYYCKCYKKSIFILDVC